LNLALAGTRISRDIGLFHDSSEALEASWKEDLELFEDRGLQIEMLRDVVGLKEALVRRGSESVLVQWARDSAYRFFPLVEHREVGLMLHSFDLATNKVLALVGRLEPRDWIDVLACDERIQPIGYLAWAACGKDPGFSPINILEEARRSGRYSQLELQELAFAGPSPDARELGARWHRILREAELVVDGLRGCPSGNCVLDRSGELCRLPASEIASAVSHRQLVFHPGSMRGSVPTVRSF